MSALGDTPDCICDLRRIRKYFFEEHRHCKNDSNNDPVCSNCFRKGLRGALDAFRNYGNANTDVRVYSLYIKY